MITSAQQTFSDKQAITGSAASTNYIDLGDTGTPPRGNKLARDIGKGQPVHLEAQVTTDFATLTSLTIAVQVDDNTSFSSPKTVSSETIVAADLVAGKNLAMQFVPNGVDQRYVRIYYTVGGSNATAGNIWAGISAGRQTNV